MLAVPVGLLASAILVVNNVRDLETDRRAGKRTLAVRLGRSRARTLYAVMVYVAFLSAPLPWLLGSVELSAWLLLPLLALPLAVPVVRMVRTAHRRPVLEWSACPHRDAPARVLRPAVSGHPGELMAELTVDSVTLQAPRAGARGLGRAGRARGAAGTARLRRRRLRDGRGGAARALRRRLARLGGGRARRLRGRALPRQPAFHPRRAARRLRSRAPAAAGAGRDRPRALGPCRPADGLPGGAADRRRRRARGGGQRDDRAPRTAPARPRRRHDAPRRGSAA